MKDLYFETFFKSSQDYYIVKLKKFENGKKVTFNLAAFLFGFLWFIYRKMYLQALILLVIVFILGYLEQILYTNIFNYNIGLYQLSQIVVNIMCAICTGFFGNWIYINHAKNKVDKILVENYEEKITLEKLSKVGGTSYLAFIIAILFFVLLLFAK